MGRSSIFMVGLI